MGKRGIFNRMDEILYIPAGASLQRSIRVAASVFTFDVAEASTVVMPRSVWYSSNVLALTVRSEPSVVPVEA